MSHNKKMNRVSPVILVLDEALQADERGKKLLYTKGKYRARLNRQIGFDQQTLKNFLGLPPGELPARP